MPQAIAAVAAFAVTAFNTAQTFVYTALAYGGLKGAIGAAATEALATKIVVTAAMTAASAGIAVMMRPSTPSSGMTVDFKPDPKAPITGMMGRAATGGNKVFQSTWGYNNVVLTLGAALSLGPIQDPPTFYADNNLVTFSGAQNEAIGFFAADMWQKTTLGNPNEATPLPPTGLKYGTPGLSGWNSTNNPKGVAFSLWTMVLAKKPEDRDVFTNGVPDPLWVGRWMKVYDWRKDSTYPGGSGSQRENQWNTWEYSENPYVHARAFLRGHYKLNDDGTVDYSKRLAGVGLANAALDMDMFTEAANVADANEWVISGSWTSTDSKWDVLVGMMKAGGGLPIQNGAQISVLVNAPRVSTATITRNDVVGEIDISPLARRRERKNTIIPRYRSEAHKWEYVPAGPVTSSVYRDEDRGELRSLEIQYTYVRQAKQAAQLAAYDLANLREGINVTATLKADAMSIRAGDCVTFDVAEVGLANQKCVVLRKTTDYKSATVTIECRSETDGKNAWALGQAANPPPTPSLSGVDPRYAPTPVPGDWVIIPVPPSDGVEIPIIVIEGETGTTDIAQVIIEYALSATPADTEWVRSYAGPPKNEGKYEIIVQPPGVEFWASIQYVANNGAVSARTIKGPYTAPNLVAGDTTHVGGVPIDEIPAFDTTPPAVPSGLTLTTSSTPDAAGNPYVRINATWTAVSDTDLAGYEVEVTESGFTVVDVASTNRWSREALTGRTYAIRVRAFDKAGNRSAWGASQNVIGAGDTTPPVAPTAFTALTSIGSVFLEWTNPAALDVSKVEVWENTTNNSATATRIATVNAAPSARGGFTRSGLETSNVRWYWLKAVDTSGNASVFSSGVTVTLPTIPAGEIDTTPPGNPTALILTTSQTLDAGSGQPRIVVEAYWTGPSDSDLAGFHVEVTEAGGNPVIRVVSGSHDLWDASPGKSYTVRVRAFDRVNNRSGWTATQTIVAGLDSTPPSVPTALTTLASVGSIFLSGTAPSNIDLAKIEIWSNTTNSTATATRIAVVNAVPSGLWKYTQTGLAPNDVRWYWAKSVDTSGNVSGFSTGVSQVVPYVANADIAVGTLTGDRVVAGSIEGDRISTTTSLPGTITVGSTGVSIGTIQGQADDPIARANTKTTRITPGLVQISGATNLSDWRMGGDDTRIDGGAISANTIDANKLTIGQRGVQFDRFNFTAIGGVLTWTVGRVTYVNDSGVGVSVDISAGSHTYGPAGVTYVYWIKGAASLSFTKSIATAMANDAVVIGTFYGDNNFTANYGRTVIDGGLIQTDAITANKISVGAVTAGKLAANSVAADNIIGGTITGDKISTSTSLPGTITVGSTGVSIGTIQSQADDPAARVNAKTTLIQPGLVQISGATTLSSWRQGGDDTKIAGGSISTNTIDANKLTIGSRGVQFDRFNFSATGGVLTWATGRVTYVNDSNVSTTADISSGTYTYAGAGVTYIYWTKGAATLSNTKTLSVADSADSIIVGTFYGGNNFTANYGRTVIDGGLIQTGAVTADKITVTDLAAITANLGTVTTGRVQNTAGTTFFDLTNARSQYRRGAYDLRMGTIGTGVTLWYGPTSIAIGSETRTNGVWAFGDDGKVYYGSAELGPGGSGTKTGVYSNNITLPSSNALIDLNGVTLDNLLNFSISGSGPGTGGGGGGWEIREQAQTDTSPSAGTVLISGLWTPIVGTGGFDMQFTGAYGGDPRLTDSVRVTGNRRYRLNITYPTGPTAVVSMYFTAMASG